LIDLDYGDVVPAEPGTRERAVARLRVPVQHEARIDTCEPERDEPRAWLQAEPRARRLARDQDRGRPVADLARVPGGDHSVLHEGRAQLGQRLERGVGPRRLVHLEE